jgi:hypothetical protein
MKNYKITLYTNSGNVFQSYVLAKNSTQALKEYVTLLQIPFRSITNISIKPIHVLADLPQN